MTVIPLTDGPIRSERKDVVDQVTDPRASPLQPPTEPCPSTLGTSYTQAVLTCSVDACMEQTSESMRNYHEPAPSVQPDGYHGKHWKVLMHACTMESCRNFHRVLSLRGNLRVG